MSNAPWRPATEAEAASTTTAFVEWLCAVRGVAPDGPTGLAACRREHPAAFAAAILAFVGRDTCHASESGGDDRVRAMLLGGDGNRIALEENGRCWSRADLLRAPMLPAPIDAMLAALSPADLPALAASHLLDVETRPDTRLIWRGNPADPWPLGAWLAGATLVLGGPAHSAGTILRASPLGWRDL